MHPHRIEDWTNLNRMGRWRFIVSDGVRSAIATAFGGTIFAVSAVACWAHRDGQTLDFRWFQIAGQPGAPVFFFVHHAITLLLVGVLGQSRVLAAGRREMLVAQRTGTP
jgi:hypothetical protein